MGHVFGKHKCIFTSLAARGDMGRQRNRAIRAVEDERLVGVQERSDVSNIWEGS